MSCRATELAVVAAMISIAVPARAGGPDDLVGRDVVLDRGGGEVAATAEVNLAKRVEADPSSLAPDLWYGVTGAITVGVIHSGRAIGTVGAGGGLCFRGRGHGCPSAYANVGLDVRVRLRRGAVAIAARLRVIVRSFEPIKPSIRPGAVIRVHCGRFAAIADPQLQLGLANRDQGNRDWLRIPVWLALQPARRIAIALRTGLDGELATFGDTYRIPLGLDVTARVGASAEVSAFFGFPSLGGPQNMVLTRVAWLTVSARWP